MTGRPLTSRKPLILKSLRQDTRGVLWPLREDGLWQSSLDGDTRTLAELERGPYGPTREVVVGDTGRCTDPPALDWLRAADLDQLVTAVLDAAIVWRQEFGESEFVKEQADDFTSQELALIVAVDAMLAARHDLRDTTGR